MNSLPYDSLRELVLRCDVLIACSLSVTSKLFRSLFDREWWTKQLSPLPFPVTSFSHGVKEYKKLLHAEYKVNEMLLTLESKSFIIDIGTTLPRYSSLNSIVEWNHILMRANGKDIGLYYTKSNVYSGATLIPIIIETTYHTENNATGIDIGYWVRSGRDDMGSEVRTIEAIKGDITMHEFLPEDYRDIMILLIYLGALPLVTCIDISTRLPFAYVLT